MSSRAIAVLILTGLILATASPTAAAEPGKDPNGRSSQAPGQQEDHHRGRGNPEHPSENGRRGGGNTDVQNAPVAPDLTVHEHPDGNHLVWTEPEFLEVTGYQIYSIPPGGQLEPVAQVDASQFEYLDAVRPASAWYVVIPLMQEGMGPSSNPASATGCSWLTIDMPPILRPECMPVDLPVLGPSLGNPFQPPIESDYRTIFTD